MPPVIGASIDVGSNTVHVLVARVVDHHLESLADESVFLGLGAAVASRAHLGAEARAGLVEALRTYVDLARSLGAEAITIIGTEPIRRAADGPLIVHDVGTALGLPFHVLTHEEEAFLTVVGVTEGRPVANETLVVDIGGGSSEFCVVGPTERPRAVGLRLGSGRLTERVDAEDPPSPLDLARMRTAARLAVEEAPDAKPQEIVGVGGTASNLLKVLRPTRFPQTLTRADVSAVLTLMVAAPAEASAARYLLKLARARILPAGALIVDEILRRYDTDAIRVSEAGIRDGAILVAAHAGPAWRDRLPGLAHGWRA